MTFELKGIDDATPFLKANTLVMVAKDGQSMKGYYRGADARKRQYEAIMKECNVDLVK